MGEFPSLWYIMMYFLSYDISGWCWHDHLSKAMFARISPLQTIMLSVSILHSLDELLNPSHHPHACVGMVWWWWRRLGKYALRSVYMSIWDSFANNDCLFPICFISLFVYASVYSYRSVLYLGFQSYIIVLGWIIPLNVPINPILWK